MQEQCALIPSRSQPMVNDNAKPKHNKTPYTMADSSQEQIELLKIFV